ncbi:MAG: hypothetical protein JO270_14940 [Acidobacteriaceae bacterium]|nr:hypothetical protein [Acidobacteriaceae bacterium]
MIATALASQMLWAAVAHVGNDALAVPLTIFFLGQLAAAVQDTSARNVLMLAAVLAFGLLTKAYFLAFVPVFLALLLIALRTRGIPWQLVPVALALVLLLAAPWYARNFALYSSISGTQQSVAGIGLRQAVSAFPQIDWIRSATEFSRWSLWTGNYSFLSFSKITLDIEIWLVRAGLLIYLVFWRSIQKAELWLWAACGCFGLSLVYQTCVTWVESHGLARFAEPWYGQGVIICVWALCFLAFGRWPSGGRWIAAVLVVVSAWIAAMTYLAKLLPYYAGGIKMGIASAVWKWWLSDPWTAIGGVTLAPAPVVRWLLIVFNVLLIAASVAVVRELLTGSHSRRSATK